MIYFVIVAAVVCAVALLSATFIGEVIYSSISRKPMKIMQPHVHVEPVSYQVDFNNMTIAQLRAYAKQQSITITSTDKKADIIRKLTEVHNA